MRITAEYLLARRACLSEVDIFRKHWPNGAKPLIRTFRKAELPAIPVKFTLIDFSRDDD